MEFTELTPTQLARFWSKVKKTETCWLWRGERTSRASSYGAFRKWPLRMVVAHRVAWELTHGPIPKGKWIKQSCHNRLCVNPAHLYSTDAQGVRPDLHRFWNKVIKTETCWIWRGARANGLGYGLTAYNGCRWLAHRLSWTLHYGTIPADRLVLHDCDIPTCVNPAHLYLGDHADNMRDKVSRDRQRKGEGVPTHVLTEAEATRVLQRLRPLKGPVVRGQKTDLIRAISVQYNVEISTIWAMHYGRSWKHLQ